MNLYRLDTPEGPVCDLLGPTLLRRFVSAREVAEGVASEDATPCTITRIDKAGRLSVAGTVYPNGRYTRQ